MDRHIFVCATNGKVETNVIHLQWHYRRSEIIHRKDRGITRPPTRQCTWNGLTWRSRQGLQQLRKEKIVRLQSDYERQIGRVQNFTTQQSISSQISFGGDSRKFHSIAAIINRSTQASHCWSTRGLDQASNKGWGCFRCIHLQLCDLEESGRICRFLEKRE